MKPGRRLLQALAVLLAACLLSALLAPPGAAHGGQDTFFGEEAVYAVAWNAEGTAFAVGTSSGNISVYDGGTHTIRLHWKAHEGPINQVEFAPGGARMVSASGGYKNSATESTVKVWDLPAAGQPVLLWNRSEHYDWVPTANWSPDGRLVASASGVDDHDDPTNAFGEVFVWDASSGVRVWTSPRLPSYPTRLAWSPDGREIASAGHLSDLQLLNHTTGQVIEISPTFRDTFGHASHGWAVDWSPDARYIVAGFSRDLDQDGSTDRGPVVVFDTLNLDASGLAPLVREAYVHTKPTQWVTWDSTGGYIASCSGADVLNEVGLPGQDGVVDVGEVVVYNFSGSATQVLQGMNIFRGGFSFCSSVAWRPGNLTVLAGNADGTARLYVMDEDGDGCWLWQDDAPVDPRVCKVAPEPVIAWWANPVQLGLLLGGVGAVAAGGALFLRGRARQAQEEEEREARGRRGGRGSPTRQGRRDGRTPRGGRRRGARR